MVKRMMCAAATVMLVLVCGGAQAAEWSRVLEQVKAKYAQFNHEISDVTLTQQMTTMTPEGTMNAEIVTVQKGNKFRSENTMHMPDMPQGMGPMKTTMIFDGKDAWMISPMMGRKKMSPKESADQQKDKNWWELVSAQATITGEEQVNGRQCYVVSVDNPKNAPFSRIWLDKNNLVLMRMESKGPKKETMVIAFSDFKKIKGDWEIPYITEMFSNGALVSTIVVKSVQVNQGVSDEQFDAAKIPAEKQGFSMGDMMKQMAR